MQTYASWPSIKPAFVKLLRLLYMRRLPDAGLMLAQHWINIHNKQFLYSSASDVVLMLSQRLRRRPNINPALRAIRLRTSLLDLRTPSSE